MNAGGMEDNIIKQALQVVNDLQARQAQQQSNEGSAWTPIEERVRAWIASQFGIEWASANVAHYDTTTGSCLFVALLGTLSPMEGYPEGTQEVRFLCRVVEIDAAGVWRLPRLNRMDRSESEEGEQ